MFLHNDLKNIAISGTYGAGKSTLIQSYEKKTKKEKFVYISLARFGEDCSKNEDSSNNNNQTHETPKRSLQTLENKVINQLIHSVAPHRIPRTRFPIKKEIFSSKRLIIKAFLTVLPLLLLHHIKFNYLKDYIDALETQDPSVLLNVLSFIANEWALFFTGILLVVASFYLVYVLITYLESNKLLAKVSLGSKTIEIFAAEDDSNFDRYLDELLYIIECSQAKVFVFEDIDRFKSSEIFVRLREINQLVNQRLSNDISKNGCRSSQNKHPRVIRFFYMMRDDLFTCKDRTKFFDFIIPVVPIIVATNSYEQLAKMLNTSNLKEQFDDYFLRDISLYIDDMRVLKNIVNEYQIYSKQLRERPRLDCNKLFALISYKNLYPKEFTKLQCSQGPVYDLFACRKSQFVVGEVNSLNERIKSLNSEREELLAHEQEVASTGTVPVSSTSIAECEDYPDIQQELEKLINKKNKMETSKLHELINEDNENEMLGCLQPLIKYLIRQGYLDETYADYMSYFIGESNTPRDHQFLRSVTDRQAEEFDYQLDYPERILVDLNPAYFGNVETLNNALLDYILENESKYSEQKENIFQQIQRNKEGIDFIHQYIERSKKRLVFIKKINLLWPQVWQEVLNSEIFSAHQLHHYVKDTLLNSSSQVIDKMNIDNSLTDYISHNANFLKIGALTEAEIDWIVVKLLRLGVRFTEIAFKNANKQLFQAVYKADLYALNNSMISLILRECYEIAEGVEFKHKNYTLVISNKEQPLVKYVDKNMEQYVKLLLETCDSKIHDSEDAAIELLNHPDVTFDSKKGYLNNLEIVIQDITSVCNKELWPIMLVQQVAKHSEGNILQYYFTYSNSFDGSLIEFINNNDNELNFDYDEIGSEFGEDMRSNWLSALITCNELLNVKYELILAGFKIHYNNFSFEGIESDKVRILLKQTKIKMNSNNLKFLRANYHDHVIEYISLNITEFLEDVVDEDSLTHEEIQKLLSKDIADGHKILLLKQTDKPISVLNQGFSVTVQEYVLENNFDENEMEHLIVQFDSLGTSIQEIFKDICIEKMDRLIKEQLILPFTLLKALLQREFDVSTKQKLLGNSLHSLSIKQAVELLKLMSLGELVRVFRGGRLSLPLKDEVKRILEICEDKEWISSFKKYGNQYRAFGFRNESSLKQIRQGLK